MITILFFLMFSVFAYDEQLSKYYTELSQSTYCVSSLDDWSCVTCSDSIKLEYVVENNGACALQGYDSKTNSIFTAFRGSSNVKNWINNIQISKLSPYNDSSIMVEKGFYKSYQYLQPMLFDNLLQLQQKYGTYDISITGHSLGAAQATLYAYDIGIMLDYTVKNFYTFGSPRVGNSNFVNSFSLLQIIPFRVTHYYDIVPHVPEEILGYLHIPNEIWYNEENSKYKKCNEPNNIEDETCSDSCAPIHCTSFDDHVYYLNVSMGNDPLCF